jgi:hypothetical protein
MNDMSRKKYGPGPFVPDKLREAATLAHRAKQSVSLVQDKNATPSEPAQGLREFEATIRPLNIEAQRRSAAASMAHEEHKTVLSRYQNIEIVTGSAMMDQFQPQYLGLANLWTMPTAVGGYDIPGKKNVGDAPLKRNSKPSSNGQVKMLQ